MADTTGKKQLMNTATSGSVEPSFATITDTTAVNNAEIATNNTETATNNAASIRTSEVFPALSAPGKLWLPQIPGGAAVDIAAGFARFLPMRGLRVTMGAGAVACNVVVSATLTSGAPVDVTFETTGPGTYELPAPFDTYAYESVSRVVVVIDPVGTIDLETNGVFALNARSGITIQNVSTDDVVQAEPHNDALGTVVPTAAPNGARTYYVDYTLSHNHVQNAHGHTQNAHTHTQVGHNHAPVSHTHNLI